METLNNTQEIKPMACINAIRETTRLLAHKAELPTQKTQRAIDWQTNLINNLEADLIAFSPTYLEEYRAWQNTAV